MYVLKYIGDWNTGIFFLFQRIVEDFSDDITKQVSSQLLLLFRRLEWYVCLCISFRVILISVCEPGNLLSKID